MFDFFSFDAIIYKPIYMWTMLTFCVMLFAQFSVSTDCNRLLSRGSAIPAFTLSAILILFVGLRPVSYLFGDTVNYAHGYNMYGYADFHVDTHEEWLWATIKGLCQMAHFTVNEWFLVIEIGYIGFAFLGLRRLLWESPWMALMFFLSAFSTWSFGVNGLRNGLACSMLIYAFSMLSENESSQNALVKGLSWGGRFGWAAFIAFLAMGIHRSTSLPIAGALVAIFLIKKPINAVYIWAISIPLSFVIGGTVTNFFMGLGFDDRMTSYVVTAEQYKDSFSGGLGFRWDFLAYSSMPVLLTWYVNKKASNHPKEDAPDGTGVVADENSMRMFNILATTYILCNTFWIYVIRASFSNRFAYLSWFLYPVVIAYGVIRLHIWKDQDRKSALILLMHAGFTIFMYMIGKA